MDRYITSQEINYGFRILPIKRLELFSPDEWELFIKEWLETKNNEFIEIERFGGAGDMGRDVVAYVSDKSKTPYLWECYQCKHYDKPLMPSQIWSEFGKILYYTYTGAYPVPRKYFFVAPKGCGTSLSRLLQDSNLLKDEVINVWNDHVKDSITDKKEILLEGSFLDYVNNFDFSIFDKKQPKQIIDEHEKHPNHLLWFGGGLPSREKLDESKIPVSIQAHETLYVSELLKAYTSEGLQTLNVVTDLVPDSVYQKHFKRARISFHHAEQLRNFSRDNLPVGTFEDFQQEVHDGIVNIIESSYPNGFAKVKAVETHSSTIQVSSNALKEVSIIKDKTGICHQLCNNGIIKWTDNG